jgi:spore maturation protein CgeB
VKILVVGDWHSDIHETPISQAFESLGHKVIKFSWYQYFLPKNKLNFFNKSFLKFQNKYLIGPMLSKLNNNLLELFEAELPDMVFIYRGTHIFSKTLSCFKNIKSSSFIISYNNDNPFSDDYRPYVWRHYFSGVVLCNLALSYRQSNVDSLLAMGVKDVKMLRSWFVPKVNYPVKAKAKHFETDVVFIGHYENDDRVEYLEEVVKSGWKLKIFGPDVDAWNNALEKKPVLRHLIPIRPVWGEEYNMALSSANIALCFFSKLNRDTYTRRCFEIPACDTVLLSEYSQDVSTLFREGTEALFFRSKKEMGRNIDKLLQNPQFCQNVADAGLRRVWDDKHDVVSRMNDVVKYYYKKSQKEV